MITNQLTLKGWSYIHYTLTYNYLTLKCSNLYRNIYMYNSISICEQFPVSASIPLVITRSESPLL